MSFNAVIQSPVLVARQEPFQYADLLLKHLLLLMLKTC